MKEHLKKSCSRTFIVFFMVSNIAGQYSDAFAVANSKNDTESRYRALETFAKALYFLESMYIDEKKVTPEASIKNALQGIVSNLDPHTVLMPKKAFEQLTIDTKGKFGGVGIIVSQEKSRLIIISPIEDTPAYNGGIKSGDEIIAINNILLSTMKGNEAVEMMRGLPGTTLHLRIKSKNEKKTKDFFLI